MTAVTAPDRPPLADRCMRARRESQCPACEGWIRVTQHIARVGGVWIHAGCAVRRITAGRPGASP